MSGIPTWIVAVPFQLEDRERFSIRIFDWNSRLKLIFESLRFKLTSARIEYNSSRVGTGRIASGSSHLGKKKS